MKSNLEILSKAMSKIEIKELVFILIQNNKIMTIKSFISVLCMKTTKICHNLSFTPITCTFTIFIIFGYMTALMLIFS